MSDETAKSPRALTENENMIIDKAADAECGDRVTGPGNGTCTDDCPGCTLIRSNVFRGEQATGGSVYATHVTRTYICSGCRRPVAWVAEHPGL